MDWNSPFLSIRISVFQSSRCGLGSGSWLTFVLLFHSAWYYSFLAFLWLLFSIIFFFSEACWEQYKRNRVHIETISMKWKWNFIFLVYLIPKGGWQILACCCLGGRWRAPLVPSYAVIDTLFSQTFWWGIFSLLKIWWFLS